MIKALARAWGPQEIVLVLGLVAIFGGVTHEWGASRACIVLGALAVCLAWPRPLAPTTKETR